MGFHLAAPFLAVLFQLPLCGGKGVAERYMHLFMSMIISRFPARYELLIGNGDIDEDVEQIPLLMALVTQLHYHTTSRDYVGEQLFQLFHVVAHIGLDGIRMIHIAESKL